MLPIFADIIRIATFQTGPRDDARWRREEERRERDLKRLTAHLDEHLRRDVGIG